MQSLILDGKVLDFKYREIKFGVYSFSTGHISQGTLYNLGKLGWTAVSNSSKSSMNNISGFITRYKAAEYLLRLNGYWSNEDG